MTPLSLHSKGLKLMGNQFGFSVVSGDGDWAMARIEEAIHEVRRIERLLTTFDESSVTNAINRNAGIHPVEVPGEVFDLVERSLRISELTQGAFDITYGSMDKRLWNFDTTMTSLPDPLTARKMVRLINYRNVVLDRNEKTIFLKEEGMRIGFGGIGKGYAADRARDILVARGVNSGIVNASGDLTVWGTQPNGEPWTIGIADPGVRNHPLGSLQLSDASVATSGNYEKYVMIGGRRYSHTIDPKTGYPVHGIRSVTVVCRSAELADALATPVMVMGIEAALHLIDQLAGVGCVVVTDDNVIHTSKNIRFT